MNKGVARRREVAICQNDADFAVTQEGTAQHRADVRRGEHGYGDTPTPVYDRVLSGLRPMGQHEAA
ncbi:MAG: hypothetical protein AAGA73_06315 [Pseudomonadota bacterium]